MWCGSGHDRHIRSVTEVMDVTNMVHKHSVADVTDATNRFDQNQRKPALNIVDNVGLWQACWGYLQ